MRSPRSSGILLHPTSLPGRFGIGDLGPEAHGFVDFLAETGQRWWQILPLGPTGGMNSPYQSHSSFAGNPLLISPEGLVERGWLEPGDLPTYPGFPADRGRFRRGGEAQGRACSAGPSRTFPGDDPASRRSSPQTQAGSTITPCSWRSRTHGGQPWYEWEPELVARKPAALARWRDKLADERPLPPVRPVRLRHADERPAQGCARRRRIGLIGDIPIFVAHDSADVWAQPDCSSSTRRGRPTCVAGVPPDYFSATGQLWGNPLYRWEAHAGGRLRLVDRPAERPAEAGRPDPARPLPRLRGLLGSSRQGDDGGDGRWVPGPGAAFFQALQKRFGDLPLIAEDLGVITPAVEALRDRVRPARDARPPVRLRHRPARPRSTCRTATSPTASPTRARTTTTPTVGWLTSSARPDDAVGARRSRPSAPSPSATWAPAAASSTGT